jgi:hypothetical protein
VVGEGVDPQSVSWSSTPWRFGQDVHKSLDVII